MKKKTKIIFTTLPIFFLMFLFQSIAQTNDFDSGSTGTDGDLMFDIANGTDQVFDHLAAGHEGILNFNSILIPAGVTVTFPAPLSNLNFTHQIMRLLYFIVLFSTHYTFFICQLCTHVKI